MQLALVIGIVLALGEVAVVVAVVTGAAEPIALFGQSRLAVDLAKGMFGKLF